MKQRILGFCAAAVIVGLTACSNDGGSASNTNDSASTATNTTTGTETTTSTTTSEGAYAAMADSVERNSQQGYYLNPRTGKAYNNLKVDRSTGRITSEAGEPVWRYVDRRNWWVYGGDNWGQVGEAKMQGEKLMYKGDNDQWVDYDARWKKDDGDMEKKWKSENGDAKMKVEKDGDIKIKDGDTKIKHDADEGETKIKSDGKKTKIDKDGNVKQN